LRQFILRYADAVIGHTNDHAVVVAAATDLDPPLGVAVAKGIVHEVVE
jgi:hypothetical protein